MPKILKNVFKAASSILVFLFCFMSFEPAIIDAADNVNVTVTQVVTAEISITKSGDVTMAPTISGITGGTGNGNTTLTVITNNTSGFNLKVKSIGTLPALKSAADDFADYTWTSPTPDFTWTVAASASEFGFTVEASTANDTVQAFKSTTSVCNSAGGSRVADSCWAPFSLTDYTIINRSSPTTATGVGEILKFRAQSGSTRFQQQGTYTATITATAVVNP